MFEAEVFKLYGLRHTNMTMHERFTLLAHKPLRWGGKLTSYFIGTQSKSMNPELLLALTHPLEGQAQRPVRVFAARGRGRGRGGLHRTGSEGSFRGLRGLPKSNSYRNISQSNKDQKWRRSNGNLSANGSVYSGGGSEKSWGSGRSGHRGRGARSRGRGRGFRNRTNRGRVTRVTETAGVRGRPARGVGRRGLRRNIPGAQDAPARGRGTGYQRGRGRGRGGISRNQQPKLMLTKEELDAQLDQYMAGTKASLDKELEEYMSRAMDYD